MVDDIRPRESQKGENKNPLPILEEDFHEQEFVPPTLVEKEDGFISSPISSGQGSDKRFNFKLPHIWFREASRRERIIGGIIIAVLLVLGGGGVYAANKYFSKSADPPTPVVEKNEPAPPPPTTEPSRLTGVEIPIEVNKRPVTSIQIENSPDARPQAGLKDAGVVYEAIAEGGITRFNASFLESQPEYIGPVRSVRPYYVFLTAPFDPIFVHAGGSGEGIAAIRDLGIKDMDHGPNGGAFRRVSDRFAPHNLYTSMPELDKASQGRGYSSSNVKSFLRKKEQPNPAPNARSINMSISSPLYNVNYVYDQANNRYMRNMGGKPHTDHRSGEQIAPKVVIGLVMNFSQNGIYSVYGTTGSGTAFIFQDGIVHQGSWKKAGDREQFQFADGSGTPIAINPGQAWITLVKEPGSVTFAP